MLKVLIVDDEKKVAELIEGLIEWDKFGLEVIGIEMDGISAFEVIQAKNPDIVITDVRMPGYTGIQLIEKTREINHNVSFVILSGYKHFDYARGAVKHGVDDYLLKPINKLELEKTLEKIIQKKKKNTLQIDEINTIKQRADEDIIKLHSQFVIDLLLDNKHIKISSIEQINKDYRLEFKEGSFLFFILRIDADQSDNVELHSNMLEIVISKSKDIISKHINSMCFENLVYSEGNEVYCICNYNSDFENIIRKAMKEAMREIIYVKQVFDHIFITLGVGSFENDIKSLNKSFYAAKEAKLNKIIKGVDKILYTSDDIGELAEDIVDLNLRQKFSTSVELMDVNGIKESVDEIFKSIEHNKDLSGHLIYNISVLLVDLYIYALKNTVREEVDGSYLLEDFKNRFEEYMSLEQVIDFLKSTMIDNITKIKKIKKNQTNKPIIQAKKYMQQNYSEPITLEIVSAQIGFNPTYLSTLFKKEVGTNFLKYLSKLRINGAIELLGDEKKSIDIIANEVGFKDVKHFSKVFKKTTGVSPSQYRKIYY